MPVTYPLRRKDEQQPKEPSIAKGTKMVCKNWGCGAFYEHSKNKSLVQCNHHPGVYQFGSKCVRFIPLSKVYRPDPELSTKYKGYWPASWTCCRKTWEQEGCTSGIHNGRVLNGNAQAQCLNHGADSKFRRDKPGHLEARLGLWPHLPIRGPC
jgi:hypothetical protein